MREEIFGSQHPDTAVILSNLASAYSTTEKPEGDMIATTFFKKAVNAYQASRELTCPAIFGPFDS
jgi:hypothetical protein